MFFSTVADRSRVVILAKGIPRCKIYKAVRYQTFISALFGTRQMENIVSQSMRWETGQHVTRVVTRIPLNSFDDKRYIDPESYETIPFGHKRLRKSINYRQ